MMNEAVTASIHSKRIDSFQKLRFLLFLNQHPDMQGTIQEFSRQLYLGDLLLIEKIIGDLQKTELVDQVGNCYKLRDQPDVKIWLQYLARAYEDPLDRQKILDEMRQGQREEHLLPM